MKSDSQHSHIGVALIGAGMIAQTHVAALSAARHRVRLKAIVSRRPERADYLLQHYDGDAPILTSDLSRITDNDAIQMVIVATPPSVRIDLIEALARAGKHVLLEKPVARTLAESEQVVEICERYGVKLGVLFQHREWETAKTAARYVSGGEMGNLGHVEIAAPLWRDQAYYDELGRGTYSRDGGGVLITQAIHTIDLALSLTGPVIAVQAMTATTSLHQMEAEDYAVAGLRFANGAVGSLNASTAAFPHGKERISLHFEHGSLQLLKDDLEVSWRDGSRGSEPHASIEPTTKTSPRSGAGGAGHRWHQGVIEDFVDAIFQDRAPLVSGREALAVHRLIEAIELSSRTGQRVELDR